MLLFDAVLTHDDGSINVGEADSVVEKCKTRLKVCVWCPSDDWQFSRPSAHFLMGDMMKFEVSVKQFHHVPLRVTVDSCVATVVPNIDTVPRYTFIGNKGSVCWTAFVFVFNVPISLIILCCLQVSV